MLWLLDRMKWDTAQTHALFALTTVQLRSVMRIIYKQLDKLRIPRVFNCRPPKQWVDEWEARGIQTPVTQDRYENVVIWKPGLHLQLGTLSKNSYEQYRGSEWGSVGIEEFTLHGVTQDAVEFLFERVACGDGPDYCEAHHKHTKILHGNPPENPDHWTFDWWTGLEREARAIGMARGVKLEQTEANAYPYLSRGIGSAILIPSRSLDNPHLPRKYVENQMNRLDTETALRRLGGVLSRAKAGRAYYAFTDANKHPIHYDPSRTVYLFQDFNKSPAVTGFAHPLNPGEYPSEHARSGISYVGVFAEFFHVGGMDAYEMANAILSGDHGSGGHFPSKCGGLRERCCDWRGLAAHHAPIVAFGDATAGFNRMAGPNEWSIVNEVYREGTKDADGNYRYSMNRPPNPLVVFGVRSVNAKLCAASGIRSLFVDPRCTELIQDFMSNVWDKTGTDIQKYGERGGRNMHLRTHIADALRYMIHALFPLGKESDPLDDLPRIIKTPRESSTPSFI